MRPRLLGVALILYGVLGIGLLIAGIPVGIDLGARLERLAVSADGSLQSAADSASAAAGAVSGLDTSLERAMASSEGAAALARDASVTLGSLANAMELSIFGAQPLLPLAADFSSTSEQAAQLGEELDGIGSSMASSRQDLDELEAELNALASELSELRGSATDQPAGAPAVRLSVLLLLAWLAIPVLGALFAGAWLLLRARQGRVPSPRGAGSGGDVAG